MPKMLPRSCNDSLFAACAALAAGACVLVSATPACGPTCDTTDTGNPAERYEGGTVSGTASRFYVSSDWTAGLLHFPGGKRYELAHHLGFTPAEIAIYVSFAERDTPVTPCSGNTCVIQIVNADAITIKNDTCSEFWVRVVASGVAPPGDAGVGPDSSATD
jgi:hypothetical protein